MSEKDNPSEGLLNIYTEHGFTVRQRQAGRQYDEAERMYQHIKFKIEQHEKGVEVVDEERLAAYRVLLTRYRMKRNGYKRRLTDSLGPERLRQLMSLVAGEELGRWYAQQRIPELEGGSGNGTTD